MKKWYALLLIAILMFTGCKKGDNDSTSSNKNTDLEFTLNVTKKSYTVTGIGDCKDQDIVIPSTYNNLPVLGIGEKAFYQNKFINSISISEGIKIIEDQAFYECSSLTAVSIPSSVRIIGDSAFYDCDYLTNVEISNGVRTIEDRAFNDCRSLTSIKIPESVKNIGVQAFYNSKSLIIYCEAKNKPSGWDTKWNDLDNYVYWGINKSNYLEQNGLIYVVIDGNAVVAGREIKDTSDFIISSTITIKGKNYKVKKIGDNAFCDNYCLNSIRIPDGITTIGKGAFKNCSSLASIYIPNTVTNIEEYAFSQCSCLSMYFEADFTPGNWGVWNESHQPMYCGIWWYNYLEQDGIVYVVIDGNVLVAGHKSNSTDATIPLTIKINRTEYCVNSFYEYAFSGISSLTNVYFNGTIEDWCKLSFVSYYSNPMLCASNFYLLKENNEYEKVTEIIIPNTITSIGDYQFCGFDNLSNITIPNSVTSIGEYAFQNCSSLTNTYFNGTIEDWCNISFECEFSNPMYYASNFYLLNGNNKYEEVTEIMIPDTITSIGYCQFYGFDNLIKVVIPTSVVSIYGFAFKDCSSLTMIEIPNSVTNIEPWAFQNCSSLTSIVIPNSVTSIGSYAFQNCTSLISIVIPTSVECVYDSAFIYCNSLTIYCEASSQPNGWYYDWNFDSRPVYWGGQWSYVDGVPTPNSTL